MDLEKRAKWVVLACLEWLLVIVGAVLGVTWVYYVFIGFLWLFNLCWLLTLAAVFNKSDVLIKEINTFPISAEVAGWSDFGIAMLLLVTGHWFVAIAAAIQLCLEQITRDAAKHILPS